MGTTILLVAGFLFSIDTAVQIDNAIIEDSRLDRIEKVLKLEECVVKPQIEREESQGLDCE